MKKEITITKDRVDLRKSSRMMIQEQIKILSITYLEEDQTETINSSE